MIEDAVLAALNHLLGQAEWARRRLAPFAGRHAQLSMPPWQSRFQVIRDGWVGIPAEGCVPDAHIAFPAEAPFLALRGAGKFSESARIEGDTEFAAELSFVLNNLRWDVEEDLSRLFGDIAAHRIAGGIGALAAFCKEKRQPKLPFPFLLL